MASRAEALSPERSLRPRPRGLTPAEARRLGAPGIDALLAEARLGGEVGFCVADARTGEVLEGHMPDRPLPPASVAKAITALYSIETLGAEHRFRTRLHATGPLRNGRLEGDLVLTGSGDPTLTTDDLADLARALREAGVVEVRGRFIVDGAALPFVRAIDPGQPEHVGYNPAISGLNLNYNRVHFEWKREAGRYALALDARTERLRPAVTVARIDVAERSSPVYTYADRDGVDDWTVARAALGNGGSRWLPVRRPQEYAGEVFRTLARGHGIVLDPPQRGARPHGATLLAEHVSPELRVVLTDMLKWSTNLTAEVAGLTASGRLAGPPEGLGASAVRMSSWMNGQIKRRDLSFVDHSGLGESSRVSPAAMVEAFVRAGPDGVLRRMLKPFEIRDAQGRALRNQPAQVSAKTGTLNFVSGLGGYVQAPSGRVLAFATFAADLPRRGALGPEQMERPQGGQEWTARARRLQQRLIERWTDVHGT
jgi:serine-type D-Ala-D-Ala carboxypeptidase/endopeptidase (penicillin-binding protein 4)